MEYKNTIITPKTDFPMKAGLPAREPGMLARWQEQDLYNLLLEKTVAVTETVAVKRDLMGCGAFEIASGKSAETAVTESRVLNLLKIVNINAALRKGVLHLVENAEVEEV